MCFHPVVNVLWISFPSLGNVLWMCFHPVVNVLWMCFCPVANVLWICFHCLGNLHWMCFYPVVNVFWMCFHSVAAMLLLCTVLHCTVLVNVHWICFGKIYWPVSSQICFQFTFKITLTYIYWLHAPVLCYFENRFPQLALNRSSALVSWVWIVI